METPPRLGYLAPLKHAMKVFAKAGLPLPSEADGFDKWGAAAATAAAAWRTNRPLSSTRAAAEPRRAKRALSTKEARAKKANERKLIASLWASHQRKKPSSKDSPGSTYSPCDALARATITQEREEEDAREGERQATLPLDAERSGSQEANRVAALEMTNRERQVADSVTAQDASDGPLSSAASIPLKSSIWRVRQMPPTSSSLPDPVFRFRFTRTYDPRHEMPEFSFEEIVAATRLVMLNKDCLGLANSLSRRRHA